MDATVADESATMSVGDLTVGEVARLCGVTVRTLHHYDEIGLVPASGRSGNGYRTYDRLALERLQLVLGYRELDLSLERIAELLDDPSLDRTTVLREQRVEIERRIERLQQVRATIDHALEAAVMGIDLEPSDLIEVFGDDDPNQHAAETAQRWGETDAYEESQRRTSRYGKQDWLRMKAEQDDVIAHVLEVFRSGVAAGSAQAMDAVEAHRMLIDRWFYPCSYEMQVGLGRMYVEDPRFRAFYDDRADGLAQYVHDAIEANAARADG
jgi:MerR family transcriptional regulator, thiopeptide resistance regulator